jgi:D-hydroxyproline dehydrogenase subunit alpha
MNTVVIWIDGEATSVASGIPLGAVLHRLRGARLRRTTKRGEARGLFCGMGTCFDCLVTIDGRAGQRACITQVADGMRVETLMAGLPAR